MHVPPDVELLAVAFLAGHQDVADLCAGRVTTDLPATPTLPAVTVSAAGGTMRNRRWTIEQVIDVDAYADDRAGASELARTCYGALLQDAPGWAHATAGSIAAVTDVAAPQPLFDEAPARPRARFTFTVTIAAHPLRTP